MRSPYQILQAAQREASADWDDALDDAFGPEAAQARLEPRGRGAPGTALNAAFEAYWAASEAVADYREDEDAPVRYRPHPEALGASQLGIAARMF